ncbi:MAG: Ig-like domain-containing protein [Gemmatimonadaceae bacterium]
MKPTSSILLAVTMVSTGCGSDRALAPVTPELPAALTSLMVKPAAIELLPGITTHFSLQAWDQRGWPHTWDAVSYVSSDPAIVTVTKAGAVTAVSPGAATIGITMTSGAITLTRNVAIDVRDLHPGRFQLTAPVIESGWGLEGASFKALLSILPGFRSSDAPAGVIGTFSSLLLVGADGAVADSASAGWVSSQVDAAGRWIISLVVGETVRWEGRVESSGQHDFIGSFQMGDGLAAGRFTAKREGD